ncbi:MAG: hypothetical protein JWL71_4404 [Acidobacteria bacterium]|nr:hypothetical protein [Acidobacteriota bacterium]
MRNFLAAVLSVIAVGVMLIAYGLLSPRVAAADIYPTARPMPAGQRMGDIEDLTPRQPMAYRVNDARALPAAYDMYDAPRRAPIRAARTSPVRVAARPAGRDWTRTAMVIGGTSAAGAGLGAIFGGKKGALIGAAIGGGAGTLFEVRKR